MSYANLMIKPPQKAYVSAEKNCFLFLGRVVIELIKGKNLMRMKEFGKVLALKKYLKLSNCNLCAGCHIAMPSGQRQLIC